MRKAGPRGRVRCHRYDSDDPVEMACMFERGPERSYLPWWTLPTGPGWGAPRGAGCDQQDSGSRGDACPGGRKASGQRRRWRCRWTRRKGSYNFGASAVNDPMLVKKAPPRCSSGRFAVSSGRQGTVFVATEGWTRTSGFTTAEFARKMRGSGATIIILTDISRTAC